jgi:hypothetical protein
MTEIEIAKLLLIVQKHSAYIKELFERVKKLEKELKAAIEAGEAAATGAAAPSGAVDDEDAAPAAPVKKGKIVQVIKDRDGKPAEIVRFDDDDSAPLAGQKVTVAPGDLHTAREVQD